jgi:predicted RNA binding protein YcfA (HicA-like mRNA interferase family)
MSKRDKLRRKLRNNPKGVKFAEIETLLARFGFRLVRIKGSHHFFEYKQGELNAIVVVPAHSNQVKPHYVIVALDLLDKLFPEEAGQTEEDDEDE